ncbi:MAG: hypothetical protein RSA65_10525, partial [Clostridia bacterium]
MARGGRKPIKEYDALQIAGRLMSPGFALPVFCSGTLRLSRRLRQALGSGTLERCPNGGMLPLRLAASSSP